MPTRSPCTFGNWRSRSEGIAGGGAEVIFSPAMTDEDFARLAERVELEFKENPSRYRTKVALLAVLGYAYLFFIAGISIGLAGLLIWELISSGWSIFAIKLVLPLAAIGIAVLRSMAVEFPDPQGVAVTPVDAPALFKLVNGLADKAGAPRPDRILLNAACNAAVAQRPRAGAFGLYENVLILGVPLLAVLNPVQATAVLAHEFGHLAGSHGRFGSWIHRIRVTWHQLDEELRTKGKWGSVTVRWFMQWYAPYFGAYSQVLIRQQELAADQFAANQVGSPAAMADALTALEIRSTACQEFGFQGLWEQTRVEERPPEGALRTVISLSQRALQPHWAQSVVAEALRRGQGPWDTHPPFKTRLAALGTEPDQGLRAVLGGVEQSALFYVLGDEWNALIDRVDQFWRQQAVFGWRKAWMDRRKAIDRLNELKKWETDVGPLSPERQWERVACTGLAEGNERTEPLLVALLGVNADHAGANYQLGRLLVGRGDQAGVALLETAARLSPVAASSAYGLLGRFWEGRGNHQFAEDCRDQAVRAAAEWTSGQRERQGVRKGERLEAHDLAPERVKALQRMFEKYPEVRRAWLGRKALRYFPSHPYYLLAVELKGWFRSRQDDAAVIRSLVKEDALPNQTLVCLLSNQPQWMRDAVRKIPGSEISGRSR